MGGKLLQDILGPTALSLVFDPVVDPVVGLGFTSMLRNKGSVGDSVAPHTTTRCNKGVHGLSTSSSAQLADTCPRLVATCANKATTCMMD